MELLFDMQQYGQPPAEIIKDLAPGLKFDENGMPIMPNMGPGMMPGNCRDRGSQIPDYYLKTFLCSFCVVFSVV